MTLSRRFPLLLLAVLLNGCAVLDTLPGTDLDSQLDQWIAERQYGRALDALSRVDPKAPNYPQMAERRRQVEALAHTYEEEVVRNARKDLKAGNWARALDSYDAALERLPGSTMLKDGLAELHQEQASRLAEQRLTLLVARARFLERALPIHERIAQIDPRNRAAQEALAEHRNALADTAEQLAKTGLAAFHAGQYEVAERTLPLAASLSDAPVVQRAHAELQNWRKARDHEQVAARERRIKRAKAREEAIRQKFEELMDEYRRAFEAARYQNARTILSQVEATALHRDDVAREREHLEGVIRTEVERLFEQGVTHYSRGEFEQAIEAWRDVLELQPDHRPAMESLERAERVLERLEQLREKQAQRNEPAERDT